MTEAAHHHVTCKDPELILCTSDGAIGVTASVNIAKGLQTMVNATKSILQLGRLGTTHVNIGKGQVDNAIESARPGEGRI